MLEIRSSERRILLTGGGTGGHVYPALAVLRSLERRVPRLSAQWVGSERIESRIVPDAGVDFHRIDIRFSYRPLNEGNLNYYRMHILPILYGRPFRQALRAVAGFRPDLVLATGGYVSAPALYAAQRLGIPYALLQLDNPPGLANWFFADGAWRIYAATADAAAGFGGRCAQAKLRITGYPSLAPRCTTGRIYEQYGIDRRRRILLAMGGSLGAAAIDRAVQGLLEAARRSGDACWKELAVLHVIGERPQRDGNPVVPTEMPAGPMAYHPVVFVEDIPAAMAASSFYLGRSGAATVGELIAAGLPSLLIPDVQHHDHQQLRNANVLIARGLGTILHQEQAAGSAVLDWLRQRWQSPRPAPPLVAPADLIADDLLSFWGDA